MKKYKITDLIPCYHTEGRCEGCKLAGAVSRMPFNVDENMEALITEVLEPASEKLGQKIVVISGFRCPLENARNQEGNMIQHAKGEAADVAPAGCTVEELARVIEELGKFDELIVFPTYVHVSYRRQGGNKKEVKR